MRPRSATDWSVFADFYDAWADFDEDLPWILESSRRAPGGILELMCGTGRVSLPLAAEGLEPVCLDRSSAMLQPLRRKLRHHGLRARVVRADVLELPFAASFSLILLPFQGLSELTRRHQRQQALHEVARCLTPGGRFLCTLHNPPVRRRELDGRWHSLGPFRDPVGDGTLHLTYRAEAQASGDLLVGTQRVERRQANGSLIERREAEIRFALPEREELESLATTAGLRPTALYGDYSGGEFRRSESSWMVWELERPATME